MKLQDLKCWDFMYYIGHLVDLDGNDWVDEETAIKVLGKINQK